MDQLSITLHFQDSELVGTAMYPIQYKRDGGILKVYGLELESEEGEPKGKIRN